MRASRFLMPLMAALLGAGVYGFYLGDPHLLAQGDMPAHYRLGAIVLMTLAVAPALLACHTLRRGMGHMARALQQNPCAELLELAASPDLYPVARALCQWRDRQAAEKQESQIKLKELEIQLKLATAERQHAQAIIYSISDAVLVTDPFDQLVLANDSAAKALHFDLNRAARTPVDKLLSDVKMVELIQQMRQSRGGRRVLEYKSRSSDGEHTYKLTLSCVEQPGQTNGGVVAVLHDMTREREVAEMKNDFVSNVSHELRTPLASIKAYVEMLIDGEAQDAKTQNEFYEVINNEANRLGRLIDNILNISRIESGLVKINKQAQSLTVLVKEALDVISPQASQKHITLEEKLTPIFFQITADHDMLYQAILNLLSNAVKYTPEGGSISVQTLVDESHHKVELRVIDTGVGIPPKDLPFVFDKFYRSEQNNRMAKGTGLGLSLVKQIVEKVHEGKIIVQSQVGQGSCFGFEMDLCQ